jgi:hypothetical protein
MLAASEVADIIFRHHGCDEQMFGAGPRSHRTVLRGRDETAGSLQASSMRSLWRAVRLLSRWRYLREGSVLVIGLVPISGLPILPFVGGGFDTPRHTRFGVLERCSD